MEIRDTYCFSRCSQLSHGHLNLPIFCLEINPFTDNYRHRSALSGYINNKPSHYTNKYR